MEVGLFEYIAYLCKRALNKITFAVTDLRFNITTDDNDNADESFDTSQKRKAYLVSWYSRFGGFSGEVTRQTRAFLTENDAKTFMRALKSAHETVLRNTNDICITITEQEIG